MNKEVKIIICSVLVFLVCCVLMFFAAKSYNTKRALQLYQQGLEFENKGDFHNAYYNFSKISILCNFYHTALLKQGLCALTLEDKKTAYQKFRHLSYFSKDKYIAPLALYNAALINLEHKKYSHAYKKLKKIYTKYPDSDYAKAALFQLGLLLKAKNPNLAKDFFVEYAKYAPSGRYALGAANEALKLRLYLSIEDKYHIANAFFINDKYKEALKLIKDINEPRCAFLCAKIYERLGMKKSAAALYLKSLTLCSEKMEDDDISFAISRFSTLSGLGGRSACEMLLKNNRKTSAYPAILFEYASYLPQISAIKCYEAIYNKYPDSYQAAQSLWHVFYYNYKNGYNSKAKALAKIYFSRYTNKNSTPAMKFWYAKILLEERKISTAKKAFAELIKSEPQSYYAYIASKLIDGKDTPFNTDYDKKIKSSYDFTNEDIKTIFNSDKTLITLARLNDTQTIKILRPHSDFILSYIAHKENNVSYGVYLAKKALKELENKPPHTDARYKLAYPIVYSDVINKYSSEYGQTPYLMLALMREESTFNTRAHSFAGAAGLMQLMPSTASSLGFGNVDANMLFDTDLNIKLGVKYFSNLKKMFDGCEMLSVLSYNGGPANVSNWKKNIENGDFDQFVEDIPYSETQNYIKRVFASYWNYSRIYRD